MSTPENRPESGFDRGYEGTRRRQARLGRSLTPLERLRWLSETVAEMRRVQGRARDRSKVRGERE